MAQEFNEELETQVAEWLLTEHFPHHCPSTARTNHGSFGAIPQCVYQEQERFRAEWYAQPDRLYFRMLDNQFINERTAVAKMVNAPPENIVLIDNATVGAVMVAQRMMWEVIEDRIHQRDESTHQKVVLLMNITYGAVQRVFEGYVQRAGGVVERLDVPFPLPNSDAQYLIHILRSKLECLSRGSVRLVVLDHISSNPCMVFPIRELVEICREYNVGEVFVDGAHAIGSVPLDLNEIGADYYVSNLHKWLFTPTSCAFFHCRRLELMSGTNSSESNQLHNPILSHDSGKGLVRECMWTGTRDYSSFLTVPKAIEFYHQIGEEVAERLQFKVPEGSRTSKWPLVAQLNHHKTIWAARMLAHGWQTNLGAPEELISTLAMVRLPSTLAIASEQDALRVRDALRERHQVESVVFYNEPMRDSYVRVTGQLYNRPSDYYRLRDAVLDLIERQHRDDNGVYHW